MSNSKLFANRLASEWAGDYITFTDRLKSNKEMKRKAVEAVNVFYILKSNVKSLTDFKWSFHDAEDGDVSRISAVATWEITSLASSV